MEKQKKQRLDVLLVEKGLAPSREKAKAIIMAGIVYVDGNKEDKAGTTFPENAVIEVKGKTLPYVSRGGLKLEKAMASFPIDLNGAVCADIGASTGGTDIVALILAKYTSMEIGKALMVSDILIVLAAAVRFGMGTGLYCILGLIGKSFVVDGAIENIRLRKVCTIMTANPQPILDFIIHNMNRSATVEKAYGAYTHHELSVLVTVLTRRQALQLRNFLRENDPHSFITIVNSSEIIGKGFRSFN